MNQYDSWGSEEICAASIQPFTWKLKGMSVHRHHNKMFQQPLPSQGFSVFSISNYNVRVVSVIYILTSMKQCG